jgi:hypothetical protein
LRSDVLSMGTPARRQKDAVITLLSRAGCGQSSYSGDCDFR